MGRMPVGEELFEDLRHEGEVRGEVRRARAVVHEVLEARFEQVPASVREAVAGTEDLALLRAWHRAVVRAQDLTTAEQAVLGTR